MHRRCEEQSSSSLRRERARAPSPSDSANASFAAARCKKRARAPRLVSGEQAAWCRSTEQAKTRLDPRSRCYVSSDDAVKPATSSSSSGCATISAFRRCDRSMGAASWLFSCRSLAMEFLLSHIEWLSTAPEGLLPSSRAQEDSSCTFSIMITLL